MVRYVYEWDYGNREIKMAQGLQCWDATGTLTVDLNDYNMRFMGTVSLAVSAGITTWSIPFPSMRPNGWLAVLRTNMPWNDYYCIPGTDSFTVQYLPTSGTYPTTLYFDVYKFDV